LAGILPTKSPHQEDSREFGHKAVEKALGANAKNGPKCLFYGFVSRLAWILPTKPPNQEDSREFGHKAVEKALGANAKNGPNCLFHGLEARLAEILPAKRILDNRATRP
jgi:hypothetical protein